MSVVAWGGLDRPRPGVEMHSIARHVFGTGPRLAQVALVAGGHVVPRLWDSWYWRKPDHRAALGAILGAGPDLVHANEAIALPIAVRARSLTGARVLFDAHELSLDQWKGDRAARVAFAPLYERILRRDAVAADAMITVAPGIARRYESALGVPCGVVLNAPPYSESPFRPTADDRITLVHHGVALRGRRLEDLIEACARLDARHHLDLMLVPSSPGYIEELRALADRLAPGRVRFLPAVEPSAIVPAIRHADIGLAVIPPVDESYRLSLPNKFFDFLMAGLAVVTGPSPQMAEICREHGCGVSALEAGPAAVAATVGALTAGDIDAMKRSSLAAARIYCAEREAEKLATLYARLVAPPGGAAGARRVAAPGSTP